jgi:hypothetical protein
MCLHDFNSLFERQNNILIIQLSICFDSDKGACAVLGKLLAVAWLDRVGVAAARWLLRLFIQILLNARSAASF